jgi:hypothetical protein
MNGAPRSLPTLSSRKLPGTSAMSVTPLGNGSLSAPQD